VFGVQALGTAVKVCPEPFIREWFVIRRSHGVNAEAIDENPAEAGFQAGNTWWDRPPCRSDKLLKTGRL
jgi:hypothetical protein